MKALFNHIQAWHEIVNTFHIGLYKAFQLPRSNILSCINLQAKIFQIPNNPQDPPSAKVANTMKPVHRKKGEVTIKLLDSQRETTRASNIPKYPLPTKIPKIMAQSTQAHRKSVQSWRNTACCHIQPFAARSNTPFWD